MAVRSKVWTVFVPCIANMNTGALETRGGRSMEKLKTIAAYIILILLFNGVLIRMFNLWFDGRY